MRTLSLLLAVLGTASLSPSFAAAPLKAYKAEYHLFYNNRQVGTGSRQLRLDADQLVLTSQSYASIFLISDKREEECRVKQRDQHLDPISYQIRRQKLTGREQWQRQFDNTKLLATDPEQPDWSLPYPAGTLDLLCHQLQLQLDVQSPQPSLNYSILDKDRLKQYQYKILGEEKISSPAGDYLTLKVSLPRQNRTTTIWLGKTLNYTPVRIQQVEKGKDVFELRLSSFSSQ